MIGSFGSGRLADEWAGRPGLIGRTLLAGLALLITPAQPRAQDDEPVAVDPLAPPPAPSTARGALFGTSAAAHALAGNGLRVGNFAFHPSVSASALYDDNVNAEDEARDEDVLLAMNAAMRAQSLYARHAVGFSASATAASGIKDEPEDVFDWLLGADGRLDLTRQSSLSGNLGYTRERQDASAVDAEDATVQQLSGGLGYDYRGQVLGWHLGGTVGRTDAIEAEFDDIDRTVVGLSTSASYRVSDRLSLFAGPSYSHATFDEAVAADGDSRDSDQVSASAGASYQVSDRVQASGSVGYAQTYFDDPDRADGGSLIGSAGLAVRLSGATRLGLNASRSLQLTTVEDADTRTVTAVGATLTHQLDRRASLSAGTDYRHSDFDGLDREDDDLGLSLGYSRRLTDRVSLNASYRFTRRLSDDDADEFSRNQILLGLSFSY
jgi:hypothetical protein